MDENAVYEALRRGMIKPEEARRLLGMADKEPIKSVRGEEWTPGPVTKALGAVGHGVLKGLEGIVAAPADIINFSARVSDPRPDKPDPYPPVIRGGTEDVQLAKKIIGEAIGGLPEIYQPEGRVEKGISAFSQGATSMAAPGAGMPSAMLGGTAGIVSELLKQEYPDRPEIAAGAGAAILAPLLVAAKKPKAVSTLQDAITEAGGTAGLEKIKAAQAAGSEALGTPTLLSHYAEGNGALSQIASDLLRSPQGAPLRKAINTEQNAGGAKIQDLVRSLSTLEPEQSTANMIALAGTKVFDNARDMRSSLTAPWYRLAEKDKIPGIGAEMFGDDVRLVAKREHAGPTSDAGKYVEKSAKKLEGAFPVSPIINPRTGSGFISDLPALEADLLRREASTAAQAAGKSLSPTSKAINQERVASGVADSLGDLVNTFSPAAARGRAEHVFGTKAFVDPLEKGAMSTIFPSTVRQTGKGDFDIFGKLFDKATNFGPADIKDVATRLRGTNPDAFPLMVKQNLIAKMEAHPTPMKFADAVIGGPLGSRTAANFEESIRQVALTAGKTAQEADTAAAGARKMMETIKTISEGAQRIGGKVETELWRKAGSNVVSEGLNLVNPITLYLRAWREAGPIEGIIRQKVFKSLAETFSSPQGIDRLIEISKFDSVKEFEKILARGLIGLEAQN